MSERVERDIQHVMLDDGVAGVEQIVITRVFRILPSHPDRTPCDPDPALAHLFDWRSAEERGVALVCYCPRFARWQGQFLRRSRSRRPLKWRFAL